MIVLLILWLTGLWVLLGAAVVGMINSGCDWRDELSPEECVAVILIWPLLLAYLVVYRFVPFIFGWIIKGFIAIPRLIHRLKGTKP